MPTITVTGHAEVATPPDEASVSLSVHAVAGTPAKAYAEAADRARTLFAVLDELEVAADRRSTSGVWVDEEPEPDFEGRRPSEYRAGERVTIRVAPEAVGTLLAVAVSRGQAQVRGPDWIVAADNPARSDVLRLAAENARTRADALAAGLGVRIRGLAEAVEGGPAYPVSRSPAFAPLAGGMPVESGASTVVGAVSVTFDVEPT
jgi:uncharacterized protein YggE